MEVSSQLCHTDPCWTNGGCPWTSRPMEWRWSSLIWQAFGTAIFFAQPCWVSHLCSRETQELFQLPSMLPLCHWNGSVLNSQIQVICSIKPPKLHPSWVRKQLFPSDWVSPMFGNFYSGIKTSHLHFHFSDSLEDLLMQTQWLLDTLLFLFSGPISLVVTGTQIQSQLHPKAWLLDTGLITATVFLTWTFNWIYFQKQWFSLNCKVDTGSKWGEKVTINCVH